MNSPRKALQENAWITTFLAPECFFSRDNEEASGGESDGFYLVDVRIRSCPPKTNMSMETDLSRMAYILYA